MVNMLITPINNINYKYSYQTKPSFKQAPLKNAINPAFPDAEVLRKYMNKPAMKNFLEKTKEGWFFSQNVRKNLPDVINELKDNVVDLKDFLSIEVHKSPLFFHIRQSLDIHNIEQSIDIYNQITEAMKDSPAELVELMRLKESEALGRKIAFPAPYYEILKKDKQLFEEEVFAPDKWGNVSLHSIGDKDARKSIFEGLYRTPELLDKMLKMKDFNGNTCLRRGDLDLLFEVMKLNDFTQFIKTYSSEVHDKDFRVSKVFLHEDFQPEMIDDMKGYLTSYIFRENIQDLNTKFADKPEILRKIYYEGYEEGKSPFESSLKSNFGDYNAERMIIAMDFTECEAIDVLMHKLDNGWCSQNIYQRFTLDDRSIMFYSLKDINAVIKLFSSEAFYNEVRSDTSERTMDSINFGYLRDMLIANPELVNVAIDTITNPNIETNLSHSQILALANVINDKKQVRRLFDSVDIGKVDLFYNKYNDLIEAEEALGDGKKTLTKKIKDAYFAPETLREIFADSSALFHLEHILDLVQGEKEYIDKLINYQKNNLSVSEIINYKKSSLSFMENLTYAYQTNKTGGHIKREAVPNKLAEAMKGREKELIDLYAEQPEILYYIFMDTHECIDYMKKYNLIYDCDNLITALENLRESDNERERFRLSVLRELRSNLEASKKLVEKDKKLLFNDKEILTIIPELANADNKLFEECVGNAPMPLLLMFADLIKTEENSQAYNNAMCVLKFKKTKLNFNIKDLMGISYLEKAMNSENEDLLEIAGDFEFDYDPVLEYVYKNIRDPEFKERLKSVNIRFKDLEQAVLLGSKEAFDKTINQLDSPLCNDVGKVTKPLLTYLFKTNEVDDETKEYMTYKLLEKKYKGKV